MTVASIESIIVEVAMDITETSCSTPMKQLFTNYVSTVHRDGLTGLLNYHSNLAVKNLVSAVKPRALQQRPETNLELTYHSYRKGMKVFI